MHIEFRSHFSGGKMCVLWARKYGKSYSAKAKCMVGEDVIQCVF